MKDRASKTFTISSQSTKCDQETVQFLWKSALQYSKISPFLSRHLMFKVTQEMSKLGEKQFIDEASKYACNVCGNLWMTGRYSMKLKSKKRIPEFVKDLQKWEKTGKTLTKYQMRIIKLHDNLTTTQVYKCLVCRSSLKIPLKTSESKRVRMGDNEEVKQHKLKSPNPIVTHRIKDARNNLQKLNALKQKKKNKQKVKDNARERLLSQIRDVKTGVKETQRPTSAKCKLVSTVKNILKSDAQRNKFNSGHQLLSFLNTL